MSDKKVYIKNTEKRQGMPLYNCIRINPARRYSNVKCLCTLYWNLQIYKTNIDKPKRRNRFQFNSNKFQFNSKSFFNTSPSEVHRLSR